MTMTGTVIEAEDLKKRYGPTIAVDGVSLAVAKGEIFGMVGPNGAGKTTTIECLQGLRRPDNGHVRVLGLDPRRDRQLLLDSVGTQLQESNLPDRIRVWEAMDLFASFYPRSLPWRMLLDRLGLAEKAKTYFTNLSGGQKQRLFIALALINDPEVVFLDELTTGLDPHARREIWELVREIRDQGKTVFMTTHYMEEAEQLCDRVAIIDQGKVVAMDTPEKLVRSTKVQQRIEFTYEGHLDLVELRQVPGISRLEEIDMKVTVYGHGDALLPQVVTTVVQEGATILDLHHRRPNLEDVFLTLTGRKLDQEEI